jgi:hypothetical protein
MDREAAREQLDTVIVRMLEIDAELAEMKRRWYSNGEQSDHVRRSALEAEKAKLAIEKHRLHRHIDAIRRAQRERDQRSFQAVLVRMLEERGHGAIVAEAQRVAEAGAGGAVDWTLQTR